MINNLWGISCKYLIFLNWLKITRYSARYRAYISRKSNGVVEQYRGRFGTGYVHYRPAFDSTTYCFIDYYIFNK